METAGAVWLCCASGASAASAELDRAADIPCIAVNDAWTLCGGARWLYAADHRWWRHHIAAVRAASFSGELCTCSAGAAAEYGLTWIEAESRPGLSVDPRKIRTGGQVGFSGAQAINLAYHQGARTILLVGYDMDGPKHFFGEHPKGLRRDTPWGLMIRELGRMAWDLSREKVRVLNCSPRSLIPYWPRMTLAAAIDRL